jgi:hypothetical protein
MNENSKSKKAAAPADRTGFDNSALTLLADHVREFLYREGGDVDKWKMILAADLERIDERK